jgi:site-specific recombinase XerC
MKIDDFIGALAAESHASPETLRAYRQTLLRFEAFLRDRKLRVTQVRRATIKDFINHLEKNKGRTRDERLAPATVARQLAILKSYYDFLKDNTEGKIRNPVERVKRPKLSNQLPRAVDPTNLSVLLDGITDVRDRAIVLTFVYSGLRLSELIQLNRDSITVRQRRLEDGSIHIYGYGEVLGKGRKRRDFRIGARVIDAIKAYVQEHRRGDKNEALFLSSRGKRISSRRVQEILEIWCQRLNIPHHHVHQLRHSFATRNVNAGMPLPVLQELMGHSNPGTTGRYFRVDSDRKTREYFSVMEYLADDK